MNENQVTIESVDLAFGPGIYVCLSPAEARKLLQVLQQVLTPEHNYDPMTPIVVEADDYAWNMVPATSPYVATLIGDPDGDEVALTIDLAKLEE